MLERAHVLAPWKLLPDGTRVPDLPTLPAGASAMDATGTPAPNLVPAPNLGVWEVWADTAYLDAQPAGAVLWREPMDTGV